MAQSRPTIAHLLHTLTRAGAELLAADLARKLKDRFHFIFICLDEIGPLGKSLRDEGFIVTDLHRRPGVDLSVARRVRQLVKKHDIGLLVANTKDEGQLAMHGMAYALSVELVDVPLLLL